MLRLKLLRGKGAAVAPEIIAFALAYIRDDPHVRGLADEQRYAMYGLSADMGIRREWVVDGQRRRLHQMLDYHALDAAGWAAFVFDVPTRDELCARAQVTRQRCAPAPPTPGESLTPRITVQAGVLMRTKKAL